MLVRRQFTAVPKAMAGRRTLSLRIPSSGYRVRGDRKRRASEELYAQRAADSGATVEDAMACESEAALRNQSWKG